MPVKNTFIGASSQFYAVTGTANSAVVLANTPMLITPNIGVATGTSLTCSGTQLVLKQTGDIFGATQMALRNRDGSNGGVVENFGLPLSDFGLAASSVITNIAISGSNVLTVTTANGWTVGKTVTLTGLTAATFLNSKVVTVATASSTQFTASFTHTSYVSAADTGTVYVQNNIRMDSRQNFVQNVANIGGEIQFIEIQGDGAGGIASNIWFASGKNISAFPTGKVGIGTASPAVDLDVQGSGIINALTGFRVAGAATSGNVLRGNGTNFISATLAASDLSNGTTGSGAVVLAGSPSLTGTTSIGKKSSTTGSLSIRLGTDENLSIVSGENGAIGIAGSVGVLLDNDASNAEVAFALNCSAFYLRNGGLGVNELSVANGNINISGVYQVGGSQIAASNLSNGTTGSGAVVLADSPTFTTMITAPTAVLTAIPGPYANNAAAITGGLSAGDLYYTQTDPRTLAVVF